MTDRRDPGVRQERDWRGLKRRVRMLEQERAAFLDRHLAERLRHTEDFERFIGLRTVEDNEGRINMIVLEERLAQLLRDRPELGA